MESVLHRKDDSAGLSWLKFDVVTTGQLHAPGNGGIGAAEHADIELDVAGEDILHPVACHMKQERKTNIPYLVVIRGKGVLLASPSVTMTSSMAV